MFEPGHCADEYRSVSALGQRPPGHRTEGAVPFHQVGHCRHSVMPDDHGGPAVGNHCDVKPTLPGWAHDRCEDACVAELIDGSLRVENEPTVRPASLFERAQRPTDFI